MRALEELLQAFERRADGRNDASGAPLVGIFGDGLPEALIHAAGATPVEVKAPPLADATTGPQRPEVTEIAEPFLDDFAARFLHRLADGAFDHMAMVVFARDDVAALTAYQYATEMRRLGMLPATGPRLHLWSLLHSEGAAAERFNRTELDRLESALQQVTGQGIDTDALARAQQQEARRLAALARLASHPQAFALRNAGRWLEAGHHANLLDSLPAPEPATGRRIGLVGTACDLPVLHQLAQELGHVAADLTPYGDIWPGNHAGPEGVGALIDSVATHPLHLRANPASKFDTALADGLEGCDLVLAAVDRNDDGFGWDLPALSALCKARGTPLVMLGFRPFRPDAAWLEAARNKIAEVLS
ncbi:hypothetical protein SAMN06297129_1644 [Pseudooceanicola antarcticus]|uniref:Benzoyl-CoA reductase/2-hydroxyglutaryl-CoA dehydratase subunit, BcrC/BadD/HgdB n=1 Tax=Pseudooceanicola antarcticus TaxID=1247613 RepID=A0A285ISM8_9RHOB|nr:2-hydroxyacyl-CoA dehydratase family protein [Pseudooceanicola antarcticus]PJE31447.1 hypothetical protein CVM39_03585 [Pseudooceanicola antarcticus]SNY49951.1 hypothetical protein SAMN06297129_1644 [Pseudooceanicola antarcticus]